MLKIQKQRKMNSKLGALILSSLLSLSLFCNNNLNVDAKDNSRTESFNSEFERSTVNKKMKDILREIANNTSKDIVLNSIDLALNGDEFSEYFMGQAVLTFGLEQRKIKYADAYLEDCYNPYLYINYSLDDIRIVNNLNGAIKMFPKQICMLTKLADFSKYSIYEMYSDSPCYVITSKERVLAIGTVDGLKSVESECVDLTSLKDFLIDEEMGDQIKDQYDYFELFEGLTFLVSKGLSKHKARDSISVSDVLVIDTTKSLTTATNKDRDYYFIYYVCPYLFGEGKKIYEDAFNENARITIDLTNTLYYSDPTNEMSLFNLDFHFIDGGSSTSCLVDLKKFVDDNDESVGLFVSEEFLKNISKEYNNIESNLHGRRDLTYLNQKSE